MVKTICLRCSTVVREVSALKKLRQRNIVELLDVARPVKEKVVWLVFELMHQNLKDRLDESRLEPSMVQVGAVPMRSLRLPPLRFPDPSQSAKPETA